MLPFQRQLTNYSYNYQNLKMRAKKKKERKKENEGKLTFWTCFHNAVQRETKKITC